MQTKDIEIYSVGLCCLSVCVPNYATEQEIEEVVNIVHPSGISNPWTISKDKTFRNGEPMPCVCNDTATRKHFLLNC